MCKPHSQASRYYSATNFISWQQVINLGGHQGTRLHHTYYTLILGMTEDLYVWKCNLNRLKILNTLECASRYTFVCCACMQFGLCYF